MVRFILRQRVIPTACDGQGAQPAALRVEGGAAIGGKLFVCKDTDLRDDLNVLVSQHSMANMDVNA